MKKNVLYPVIVCLATLLAFSSCKAEGGNEPIPPHVKIVSDFAGDVYLEGTDNGWVAVVASPGLDWVIDKPAAASWLTLEYSEGTGTLPIPCKISYNNTGGPRSVTLTATADGLLPSTVTITQGIRPNPSITQ